MARRTTGRYAHIAKTITKVLRSTTSRIHRVRGGVTVSASAATIAGSATRRRVTTRSSQSLQREQDHTCQNHKHYAFPPFHLSPQSAAIRRKLRILELLFNRALSFRILAASPLVSLKRIRQICSAARPCFRRLTRTSVKTTGGQYSRTPTADATFDLYFPHPHPPLPAWI